MKAGSPAGLTGPTLLLFAPRIHVQLLPRSRPPLLDRRRSAGLKETAQLTAQLRDHFLVPGFCDDVALLARIGLQIVQLTGKFLRALDVLQRLGAQPAHVAT